MEKALNMIPTLKKQYIFIFFLGVFLVFSSVRIINAQQKVTSNCVQTKVGDPKTSTNIPSNCSNNGNDSNNPPDSSNPPDTRAANGVVGWAEKITPELRPNLWGYLNNMLADICNDTDYCAHKRTGNNTEDLYWCSFLVVDAYNLDGIQGLTAENHLAVVEMMRFWSTESLNGTSGYVFLPYDPEGGDVNTNKITLQAVKPGMAWFMANNPQITQSQEHTGLVKSIDIDERGNGKLVTLESNSDTTSHTFPISDWTVQNTFYALRGFGGH